MKNCKFFVIFMNVKINLKVDYDHQIIIKNVKYY